jgi:hypothetical protein
MSPDRVPAWFLAGHGRDRRRRRRSARRGRRGRVGSQGSREPAASARGAQRQVRRPGYRLGHDGPSEAGRCARCPRVDPACSSSGRSAVGRRAGSIRGGSARDEWDRPPRPGCRASRRLRTERESRVDLVGACAGYGRAFLDPSAPVRRTVGHGKDEGPDDTSSTRLGPTSRLPGDRHASPGAGHDGRSEGPMSDFRPGGAPGEVGRHGLPQGDRPSRVCPPAIRSAVPNLGKVVTRAGARRPTGSDGRGAGPRQFERSPAARTERRRRARTRSTTGASLPSIVGLGRGWDNSERGRPPNVPEFGARRGGRTRGGYSDDSSAGFSRSTITCRPR